MDHPLVFSNELFLDRQNNIPVFTVPMTLVALVFLMTTDVGGGLARVDEPSYPEKQVTSWHTWLGVGSVFLMNPKNRVFGFEYPFILRKPG